MYRDYLLVILDAVEVTVETATCVCCVLLLGCKVSGVGGGMHGWIYNE